MWRSRDFVGFWSGQSLSAFGNGVTNLAYPLLMLTVTGSPAAAGALSAVRAVPYVVFGLAAGALVDRWNRRSVMILCDVGRALNMATIPVAIAFDALSGVQLVITGFVGGTFYVFFSAAEAACLPNLVSRDQLTAAVSAQQASESAMGMVAGPIGGVLLQIGRALPFTLDAVSFLASAVLLTFVRSDFRSPDDTEDAVARPARPTLSQEIRAGVAWLWANRPLRTISLLAAAIQTALSGVALVAIVLARNAGASSSMIGVLFTALGVGGVAGSLIAAPLRDRLGAGRLLFAVLVAQPVTWIVLAAAPNVVVVGVALAMFTLSMPCFGVVALSYQLDVTPDHLRSRVGTAFTLLIWAATPLGAAAAGLLVGCVGARPTAWCTAAWMAAVTGWVAATGHLRTLADGT